MKRRYALALTIVLLGAGCRRPPRAAAPPQPNDNSYLDLTAGSRLRILVPILKDGESSLGFGEAQTTGSTVMLSATNIVGYRLLHYSVEGNKSGKVRLKFASAETSRDGKMAADPDPPPLPFPLPKGSQFVRLVFLVRVSNSDHNMAILAARDRSDIETLTARLRRTPDACQSTARVSCVWTPQQIAVRPESEQGER